MKDILINDISIKELAATVPLGSEGYSFSPIFYNAETIAISSGFTTTNNGFLQSKPAPFKEMAKDVFNGLLKINGCTEGVLPKGYDPCNEILLDRSAYGGGANLRFVRRPDGSCDLQDSTGTFIKTLSTKEQNRCFYTFVLCGGGAGGHKGTSGIGFHGGGGGGGGGGVIVTLHFTDACKYIDPIVLQLYVGGGGGNNSSGGSSYIKVIEGPDDILNTVAQANGGSVGGSSGGGGGGGTSCSIPTSGEYMYVVGLHRQSGQSGGAHKSSSSGLGKSYSYNYAVNNKYITYTGGTSGAGYGDLATKPGGGGPSPFGNGNSGSYGGGGRGGTGHLTSPKDGITAARGFVEIRY